MASHFFRYSMLLQKYRTPLFIASCSGVFAANLFNHVFPNSLFRSLYQAWYKSEPVMLSEKLQDVFQQVSSAFTYFTPVTSLSGVVLLKVLHFSFLGHEGLWNCIIQQFFCFRLFWLPSSWCRGSVASRGSPNRHSGQLQQHSRQPQWNHQP